MSTPILVCDVSEQHDCAGRKSILITAQKEYDETISIQYLLTRIPMHPEEKLRLATVDIHDQVLTEPSFLDPDNPFVAGNFVRIDNLVQDRVPACRCGQLLVSDGIDIYCRNPDCPLTVAARIRKLAQTEFFRQDLMDRYLPPHELEDIRGLPNSETPFMQLTEGAFWGAPGFDIASILLGSGGISRHYISLATFLVEPLFQSFLEDTPQTSLLNAVYLYDPIRVFYGFMEDTVNNRDYSSPLQNYFLFRFLMSLGLEALRSDVAMRLVRFEASSQGGVGVMYPYAYLLTHPNEMARELGINPIEAVAITSEVVMRHREFSDIFSHYGPTPEILQLFLKT